MILVNDRDLLVIEPSVFLDAAVAATTLLSGADATVNGTSLSSAGSDFETLNIDEGHVAVVNGVALEVTARTQATQLSVSLPRASTEDVLIPSGDGTNLAFAVISFERLIERTQRDLMYSLGLYAGHPLQPMDEMSVTNREALAELVAYETLARAFAIAASLDVADQTLSARAMLYARQSAAALALRAVYIDLDGDGVADAKRNAATAALRRS